jgi:RNA polymerase sigma-70 factor (ECF subfamily)
MLGQLSSNQQAFDDDVVQALGGIEDERRVCLLLRVVHDLSYEEIAEITGLPEGTAMSHVHRAKSSLRKTLTSPATPSVSTANPKENRDE